MAGGISDAGEPVDPAVAFVATTPEVTAVVAVPKVPQGSELSVKWRRMTGPDTYETLLTPQIAVTSQARAYSVGVTDGALANGV